LLPSSPIFPFSPYSRKVLWSPPPPRLCSSPCNTAAFPFLRLANNRDYKICIGIGIWIVPKTDIHDSFQNGLFLSTFPSWSLFFFLIFGSLSGGWLSFYFRMKLRIFWFWGWRGKGLHFGIEFKCSIIYWPCCWIEPSFIASLHSLV